jgi:hypothetical protein
MNPGNGLKMEIALQKDAAFRDRETFNAKEEYEHEQP